MKKIFFLLLAYSFTGISAQHCYTLYEAPFKSNTFDATVTAMVFSPGGQLIVTSTAEDLNLGSGLMYFDGTTVVNYKTAASRLPDNRIYCIAFDGDSTWVGTRSGLAGFVNPTDAIWKVYKVANGLPSDHVTSLMIAADGTKWVGFINGKVAAISGGDIVVHHVASTPINKLLQDLNGNIWAAVQYNAGGGDGLVYYDGISWEGTESLPGNVKDMEMDSEGTIWANNNAGLFRITPGATPEVEVFSPETSMVLYQMEMEDDQTIWFSTDKGVVRFNGSVFQVFTPTISGVPPLLSKPLKRSPTGDIWFSYEYTQTFDYAAAGRLMLTDNDYALSTPDEVDLCSGSSLDIDAGEGYQDYFWNSVPGGQNLVVSAGGTYSVAVDDGASCFYYDTTRVTVLEPYQEQEICVVTVDEGKVVVAWERTYEKNTWYTIIYRESSQKDIYDKLDSIFIDDIQAYIDPDANPQIKSYKYRISVVDSCGNESAMSPPHTTIHFRANIAVNGGVNMAWTHYEGQPILSYEIKKGGSAADVSDIIATVSSSESSYFYEPAVDAGELFYRVDAVLPFTCDPTSKKGRSGPFTRSVSNLKSLPSDIFLDLSDTTLVAAANIGKFVGKFNLYINDEPSDYGITLSEGTGDSDNEKFTIRNDSLFTNTVFPYDLNLVYSIRVAAGVEEVGGIADWIFELKVNRMVGMRAEVVLNEGLKIYPNPAEQRIVIAFPNPSNRPVDIRISDLSGRLITCFEGVGSDSYEMDLTGFGTGVYLVEVCGEKNLRGKIVIR